MLLENNIEYIDVTISNVLISSDKQWYGNTQNATRIQFAYADKLFISDDGIVITSYCCSARISCHVVVLLGN